MTICSISENTVCNDDVDVALIWDCVCVCLRTCIRVVLNAKFQTITVITIMMIMMMLMMTTTTVIIWLGWNICIAGKYCVHMQYAMAAAKTYLHSLSLSLLHTRCLFLSLFLLHLDSLIQHYFSFSVAFSRLLHPSWSFFFSMLLSSATFVTTMPYTLSIITSECCRSSICFFSLFSICMPFFVCSPLRRARPFSWISFSFCSSRIQVIGHNFSEW